MIEKLRKYRRDLHRIPELDRFLPETSEYIRGRLRPLRCEVFSPVGTIPGKQGNSAVCAYFDLGKKEGVAFRSDMDALPVEEQTGAEYCSRHGGKMHACGHDGHMAVLLGLAEYIDDCLAGRGAEKPEDFAYNVLLVFQPAEETTGGAAEICNSGVLGRYKIRRIFGLHLWPELPAGVIAARKNEMMAKSCEITVEISGKSSHIARASEGRDALYCGAEFLTRAYRMERQLSGVFSEEPYRLLAFGKMESGTVRNAISAYTRLEGSLRTFLDPVFDYMNGEIRRISAGLEQETGCEIQVSLSDGYPAVINDEPLFDKVKLFLEKDKIKKDLSFEILPDPVMITEDFSFYQREAPGLFFFLGTGGVEPLHSARFDFDEAALVSGVRLFSALLRME